jgi:hypothetical protein
MDDEDRMGEVSPFGSDEWFCRNMVRSITLGTSGGRSDVRQTSIMSDVAFSIRFEIWNSLQHETSEPKFSEVSKKLCIFISGHEARRRKPFAVSDSVVIAPLVNNCVSLYMYL